MFVREGGEMKGQRGISPIEPQAHTAVGYWLTCPRGVVARSCLRADLTKGFGLCRLPLLSASATSEGRDDDNGRSAQRQMSRLKTLVRLVGAGQPPRPSLTWLSEKNHSSQQSLRLLTFNSSRFVPWDLML